MSHTFLLALVVALLLIIFWRVVLILLGAVLLAMIITVITSVSGALAGQEPRPVVTAPVVPHVQPGGTARDGAAGPIEPAEPPH